MRQLGIGLSLILFWLVGLVLQFSSEQLKLDWPALLASPGLTLFFIVGLPIVGAVQITKGCKRVRESRRAARGKQ
jgi:hypothetical protein